MARHTASIVVRAPVHDVYQMWTKFHEYPQFMSHVRSVSYIDNERTRWIVNVVGRHEWAACNDGWIPDRQIGWRSIDGLENSGLVEFTSKPNGDTEVNVIIEYKPPAGMLGQVTEILGAGKAFERQLRSDLERFAEQLDTKPKRRDPDTLLEEARVREGR
ncbi:MAG: SRPBCC family protein [Vulcanimicrobiaceae bacterium]